MKTQKKLRLGITCYPTFGGSGVIAAEIGLEMARRGHDVHFIGNGLPSRLSGKEANVSFHEVTVPEYPLFRYPPFSVALASRIVSVVNFEQLDILHMHYAVPHATSAYLARQVLGPSAPPVVTTLHGTDITLVGQDPSYLPITSFSIKESTWVTAPSEYLKAVTYEAFELVRSKEIEVIPNFVDTNVFKPAEEKPKLKLNCPRLEKLCSKQRIICHVSNFRPVKRVHEALLAFHRIPRELCAHLVMVGDGPERGRVEQLASELNLREHVTFTGKLRDFTEFLQASDIFIFPSQSESFGVAALEAMACGVPVVATNTGGIPELVTDGKTGFLCPVGEVDVMAAHMVCMLKDGELLNRMSTDARAVAVEKFDTQAMVDRYESRYYQLIIS